MTSWSWPSCRRANGGPQGGFLVCGFTQSVTILLVHLYYFGGKEKEFYFLLFCPIANFSTVNGRRERYSFIIRHDIITVKFTLYFTLTNKLYRQYYVKIIPKFFNLLFSNINATSICIETAYTRVLNLL